MASRVILGIWDSFNWPTHSNVLYLIMFFILSMSMVVGFHLVTKIEAAKFMLEHIGFREAMMICASCEIFHCTERNKYVFL